MEWSIEDHTEVPFKQISKCDANNTKIGGHLKLQIKEQSTSNTQYEYGLAGKDICHQTGPEFGT